MLKVHNIFIQEANEDGITVFEMEMFSNTNSIAIWLEKAINTRNLSILFDDVDRLKSLLKDYVEHVYCPRNDVSISIFYEYLKRCNLEFEELSLAVLERIVIPYH